MTENPRQEWVVRRSGEDGEWHMIGYDPDDDLYCKTAFCGTITQDTLYGTFGATLEARGSPYVAMQTDESFCEECRGFVLQYLGLPETAEEANNRLDREVF